MGPHRIIHNRKGYLTETYFDIANGRFCERPFPPASDAALVKPSGATTSFQTAIHDGASDQGAAFSHGKANPAVKESSVPNATNHDSGEPRC